MKERRRETKKREEDKERREERAKRQKVWKEYERKKKEEFGEDVWVRGRVVEGEGGVLRVEPVNPPPRRATPASRERERDKLLKEK